MVNIALNSKEDYSVEELVAMILEQAKKTAEDHAGNLSVFVAQLAEVSYSRISVQSLSGPINRY